jgi:hypothetical protein
MFGVSRVVRQLVGRFGRAGAGLAVVMAGVVPLVAPVLADAASITVATTSGSPGSPVLISGSGWLPYDNVAVTLQGPGTVAVCHLTANSTGVIGPQSCAVPTGAAPGSYTVQASDGSTTVGGSAFVVVPGVAVTNLQSLTLTNSVGVGQTVGLSGSDFAAASTISATFGGNPLTLSPASPVTNPSGSFSSPSAPTVDFTVPAVSAGPVTLSVHDGSSNTATEVLTVYQATVSHLPLSAASGQPAVFSASGWPPGDSVLLSLVNGPSKTAIPCPGFKSDSTGTIASTSCLVPTGIPAGSYTLQATDNALTVSDGSTFGLLPSITLIGSGPTQTNTAAPSELLEITGTGFAASTGISAEFNGTPVSLTSPVTTSTQGAFNSAFFTVPSVGTGPSVVTVLDGTHSATAEVDILAPTISTATTSGVSGQPFSVAGSGWPGNDALSVSLRSSGGVVTPACSVTTNSAGAVLPMAPGTSCNVPTSIPFGTYTVTANDGDVAVDATSLFTVRPGIVVFGATPSQRTPDAVEGQTVTLTGSGFAPGSPVALTVAGSPVSVVGTAVTGTNGSVGPLTLVVPSLVGPVQVAMTDGGANVATYRLVVYNASIAAAASGGPAGTQMSFSGNGWPDDDAVQLKLTPVGGGAQSLICTLNSNSYGVIVAQSCVLPSSLAFGQYTLIATDGSLFVTAASHFGMEPSVTLESQTLTSGYSHTVAAAVGQVVYVAGFGFQPGSNLSVSFNGEPVAWTVPTPQTNSQGSYSPPPSGGAGFTVQPVAPGPYTVSVSDGFGDTATYVLQVFDASISHSPTNGVSGSQLTVSGTGWPANDLLTLRLVPGNTPPLSSTQTICSVTTDSTGTMPPQTCTVPSNLAAGTYSVYAADTSVSAYDATSFNMNPSIAVVGPGSTMSCSSPQPPSNPIYDVVVGQAVTVAGTGWAPGTSLTATLNGNPIGLTPVPSISSCGQFIGTGFTVPSGTGTVTLTIHDNNNLTASYVLHVFQPTFAYSPSAAPAGTSLTVSGSGWPLSDPVSLRFGTVSGSTFTLKSIVCTVTSDGAGTIPSQTCTVPTGFPAGTYSVQVTDGQIQLTEPSFTLQPSILTQSNSSLASPVYTDSAAPGGTVYLVGYGFAASSSISSVTIGSTAVTFTDGTNSSGTFSSNPKSFVVPVSITAGTYTLTVKDAFNNTATESFTVT